MRIARRDRTKESFWRRVMADHAGSGLSVRMWCARRRLREASFYWWRRQLARRDGHMSALVPVRVTQDSPTQRPSAQAVSDSFMTSAPRGRMEIVLPDKHRVRITGPVDRQALSDVLGVLRAANFNDAESSAC